MKNLIIVTMFAIATVFMGRFVLDIVGEFQAQTRLGTFIIFLSLMLFSYKLVYFLFDLTYHLYIQSKE